MPSPTNTLKGEASYKTYIQQNPTLLQEPSEVQAQVALEYFNSRMEKQQGWNEEPEEVKQQAWQQFRTKYSVPDIQPATTQQPQRNPVQPVTVQQGLANLGGAIGQGIADVGQAIPALAIQAPGQIGNALFTQGKSFLEAPLQGRNPMIDANIAATSKGYDAIKGMAESLYNLPGDIGNAWNGNNAIPHTQILPNSTELPLVGQVVKEAQERNPVAGFVGENIPYMLPLGRAAQAQKATGMLRAAGEGAAIGALQNTPDGLRGRVANAALGATIPTALGVGGRMLKGKVSKKGIPDYVQETQTEFQNGPAVKASQALPEGAEGQIIAQPKGQKTLKGFVATRSGSYDFAQITPEQAFAIGSKPAAMRLPDQKLGHIIKRHGAEFARVGIRNANDLIAFIEDTVQNFTEIRQGEGKTFLLVRPIGDGHQAAYIELRMNGDHYRINTAFIPRPDSPTLEKPLLWSASEPPLTSSGSPGSNVQGKAVSSSGQQTLTADGQSNKVHDSTPPNKIEPSNRGKMPQREAVNEKTSQSNSPARGKDSPDNTELRGTRKEEATSSNPSTKETATLSGKIREFAVANSDSQKTALAAEIYSMAQDVDRRVFQEALKDAPQEVINELGKRLGC